MTTAIGAYVTRTIVKARLNESATTWDTQIDTVCDQVNAWIEGPQGCGRVIAPITSATYLLDGDGSGRLYFSKGIRSITNLSVGNYTGFTPLDTLATTDYFLRPLVQDRAPGWPAFWIIFSDQPAGTHRVFHQGFQTISLTCTAGWAAIPDDLAEVAAVLAIKAFHALEQGNQDLPGSDEMGNPIVARFVSGRDRETIRAYRVKQPAVITGDTGAFRTWGSRW